MGQTPAGSVPAGARVERPRPRTGTVPEAVDGTDPCEGSPAGASVEGLSPNGDCPIKGSGTDPVGVSPCGRSGPGQRGRVRLNRGATGRTFLMSDPLSFSFTNSYRRYPRAEVRNPNKPVTQ